MLIGLNGFMGSGKDTVADILVERHGFRKASFAALLKESVSALFDVPIESWEAWKNEPDTKVLIVRGMTEVAFPEQWDIQAELSVRTFLQRYGTESHRDTFWSEFWVDMAFRALGGRHDGTVMDDVVFQDARFVNELEAIHNRGGYNIRIDRPGCNGSGHASEVMPPAHLIDFTIRNNSTLVNLPRKVAEALAHL